MNRTVAVVAATLSLLVVAGCTGGGSPSSSDLPTPTSSGVVVANTGFEPAPNGFPFQNYGGTLTDGDVPVNLTAADVQKMFGDEVCADVVSGTCDLTPEAQAWLESTNKAMDGGHCFGFSVAAELLWQHKLDVKDLGATATRQLNIDNNVDLQRLLAYDWALQILDSVQDAKITGSPDKILGTLRQQLTANPTETYTVAIWKRDFTGGHAVTPYAVKYAGAGKYKLLIYDNNWPGKTRAIIFDTKADTWSYDAAINPSEPDVLYEGDKDSKTLVLYPTSPGLGTQPCPFCGKVPRETETSDSAGTAGTAGPTEEIYLEGSDTDHANLVVTDKAGQRIGYVNGKLVDEIPGARVDPILSGGDWTNEDAPDFFVPANAGYTLTLDGNTLHQSDTESVGLIGPGFDLSVNDIAMQPGEKDTMVVEPGATRLSYTSSRAESPTIKIGVNDDKADYSFALSGVSDRPGNTLVVSVPAQGKTLTLKTSGASRSTSLDLQLTRYTSTGRQVFAHHGIGLTIGQTAVLRFGDWTGGSQRIPLVLTDKDRQAGLSSSLRLGVPLSNQTTP